MRVGFRPVINVCGAWKATKYCPLRSFREKFWDGTNTFYSLLGGMMITIADVVMLIRVLFGQRTT